MDRTEGHPTDPWVALVIGNSRLHWAWMQGRTIQHTWDSPHAPVDLDLSDSDLWRQWMTPPGGEPMPSMLQPPELWIASVVPQQTALWQTYANPRVLTLEQVPLQHLYPTLGIDRAIALVGAIQRVGAPVLVIDAGTALTLTGADGQRHLVGGAIMPGLRLQLRSLSTHTAALPLVGDPPPIPEIPRWARQTEAAILSGVTYSLTAGVAAFIQAWQQQFPLSPVVVTGGDGAWLFEQLQGLPLNPQVLLQWQPQLIFHGMATLHP